MNTRWNLQHLAFATLLCGAAIGVAGAQKNPVEPLSNGLPLSWTKRQIVDRFGEPTKPSWDSRTFGYDGFGVMVGGAREEIWRLTIDGPGVRLASGIGVGSSAADVARVFGSRSSATVDQYALEFSYDGDRVSKIKIDPANGSFTPVTASKTAKVTRGAVGGTATGAAKASLAGKWFGQNVAAQITIDPNGTYSSPNGGRGRWRLEGADVVFTGPLAAWNHGRASFKNGNLEFSWKTPEGASQYFVLIRGS